MSINRRVFDRYFTEQEEKQLFKTVRAFGDVLARRDAAWMQLIRQTGIRITTMGGLTVGDAKEALKTGYLTRRNEISKNNAGGKIYLNKKARAALETLLKIHREMSGGYTLESPLVISRRWDPLSVRSYQNRMQGWIAKSGLPDGSPHWFRHTLAKRIMKRSQHHDPRGVVASSLGHSSMDSTLIYTQPDKEDIEEEMERAS